MRLKDSRGGLREGVESGGLGIKLICLLQLTVLGDEVSFKMPSILLRRKVQTHEETLLLNDLNQMFNHLHFDLFRRKFIFCAVDIETLSMWLMFMPMPWHCQEKQDQCKF